MHTIRLAMLGGLLLGGILGAAEPLIIAHRGASREAPENTVASARLAWKQNADGLECDVMLTSDGALLVCHDKTTGRTTDRDLPVARTPLAELRKLDAGSWKGGAFRGEKLPLLSELLATVPEGKLCYIEIKSGDPRIVAPLKKAVTDSGLEADQIIFISFSDSILGAVKQAMPEHRTFLLASLKTDKTSGRLVPSREKLLERARAIRADGVSLSGHARFDANMVDFFRNAGLSVHVWTVDSPKNAERYAAAGIDSITTNRPGFLRETLQNK